MTPKLLLGSAMWAWSVSREQAFSMLDAFYQAGFREVDAAVNYPINKNPADFRAAEAIIIDWIKAHGITDLQVCMKVGSINNMRSPEHNLHSSFLLINLDDYGWRLGSNLDTFMVHWDNRSDPAAINDTIQALLVARERGLRIGLSGILHPELYAPYAPLFDFRIQIKHHLLHSDYPRYAPFHGKPRFIAYGINVGGLKLDPNAYQAQSSLALRGQTMTLPEETSTKIQHILSTVPPLSTLQHLTMLYSLCSPELQGIIIGPASAKQLTQTIGIYHELCSMDYHNLFQAIRADLP
jgi:aryl-alcohol dehydrogenase-like predicted oxidoreductase